MFRKAMLLLGGLGCLFAVPALAQDPVATQLYGAGVHAYFSQDYRQAYDELSRAIELGTADPRCYYFRGLCYLKLGREEEAQMDFEKAAELEAQDINRFYNVSRALERIQGSPRMVIEQHRLQARLQAAERAEQLRQQRYGELRKAEQRVLEQQAAPAELPAAQPETPPAVPLRLSPTETTNVGPDQAAEQPAAEPATAAQPAAEQPAAEPAEQPAAVPAPAAMPAVEQPAEQPAEQPPTAPNPFQDVPAPVGGAMPAEPAGAQAQPAAPVAPPADQQPVQPQQPAAAAQPGQAPSGAGVFGAIGQALGDAMGGDQAAPAAAAPSGQSDNPFGGAAVAPAAEKSQKAAEPVPPAPQDSADPFGAIPAPQGTMSPAGGATASEKQPQSQPAAESSSDPFAAQPSAPAPAQQSEPKQDQPEQPPAPQAGQKKQAPEPPAPKADDPFAEDPFK